MNSSFEDILKILFRRRYHVIVFFLSMVFIPMTLAYILPPKYKAEAKIYLRPGAYKKPFMPTESNSRMSFIQVSMEDVGSEAEVILIRPILEKVVDETGLAHDVPPTPDEGLKYYVYFAKKNFQNFLIQIGLKNYMSPREEAIDRLLNQVEVDFVKRTNIITIEWRSSDPALARDVVNGIVDHYLEYHIKIHGNQDALDTVELEMNQAYEKLSSEENRLVAYKKLHSVSDIEQERKDLLEKLTQTQHKLDVFESLDPEQLESGDWSDIEGDTGFLEMRKRLMDSELDRIELNSRYGKDDQNVIAVEEAIVEIRSLMKNRLKVMMNSWREVIVRTQSRLLELEEAEAEIAQYERTIEGYNSLYDLHREKYYELTIESAMQKAQITSPRPISYSDLPPAPHFPKKMILLFVCSFLGIVGGVSWAYAWDRFSNHVTSAQEIEEISGLPVHATIPEYNWTTRRNSVKINQVLAWDCASLIPVLEKEESKSIFLLPASPKVGCTFFALPFAANLASHFEEKVLYVSVHSAVAKNKNKTFGLLELSNKLESLDELIVRDQGDVCDILYLAINASDANISVKVLEKMFSVLAERYDRVVYDIGATQMGGFYYNILRFVKTSFLVVGYDRTNCNSLRGTAEMLRELKVIPNGTILSRFTNEIPGVVERGVFKNPC